MTAHKHEIGFMNQEEGMCISLFDGRLRFEGDGNIYSNFAYRLQPDNGCVQFPILTTESTDNRAETDRILPPGVSRACPR